tara:strand:- start:143 stop:1918 length:1776 start_codon:yes stop_codon:yes gene_type:complete
MKLIILLTALTLFTSASNIIADELIVLTDVSGKYSVKVKINRVADGEVQVTNEKGQKSSYPLTIFNRESLITIINQVAKGDTSTPMEMEVIPNPFEQLGTNDTDSDQPLFFPFKHRVTEMDFSPQGRYLVVHYLLGDTNEDGLISEDERGTAILDVRTGRIKDFEERRFPNFSPDDRFVWAPTLLTHVQAFDPNPEPVLFGAPFIQENSLHYTETMEIEPTGGKFGGFLNDGRYISYSEFKRTPGQDMLGFGGFGNEEKSSFWINFCDKDADGNEEIDNIEFKNPQPVKISHNGNYAVCIIGTDKTPPKPALQIFDLKTGRMIGNRAITKGVKVDFSTDDKWLAFSENFHTGQNANGTPKYHSKTTLFNITSRTFQTGLTSKTFASEYMDLIIPDSNVICLNRAIFSLNSKQTLGLPNGFFPVIGGSENQLVGLFTNMEAKYPPSIALTIYDLGTEQRVFSRDLNPNMNWINTGSLVGPPFPPSHQMRSFIAFQPETKQIAILELGLNETDIDPNEDLLIDSDELGELPAEFNQKVKVFDVSTNQTLEEIAFDNFIYTGCVSTNLSKVAVMQIGRNVNKHGIMIYPLKTAK